MSVINQITVDLNVILRAFPRRSFKYLEIKPDLSYWSPFMGKYTRHTNQLIKTEYKKVSKDGKWKEYCREINE